MLLESGASQQYGARELKRTIHRKLTQPLATMVARSEIGAGATVQIDLDQTGTNLSITHAGGRITPAISRPTILIVDDNHDLLMFLATELKDAGWQMLMSEDATHARRLFRMARPGAVLADYMLGEDDGLRLALEFKEKSPATQVVLMTGGGLTEDELNICNHRKIPILFKPFLASEIIKLLKVPAGKQRAAVAASGYLAESRMASDPI